MYSVTQQLSDSNIFGTGPGRSLSCVVSVWRQWMSCVAAGCGRVSSGRGMTLMPPPSPQFHDSVLIVVCLPGFRLVGNSTLFCDGRRWSSEPPACVERQTSTTVSSTTSDPKPGQIMPQKPWTLSLLLLRTLLDISAYLNVILKLSCLHVIKATFHETSFHETSAWSRPLVANLSPASP